MIKGLDVKKITENLDGCHELVWLLKLSGFHEGLKREEEFTLLAPIDGAFREFPTRMTEKLLKQENMPALRSLLGLHLIKGRFVREELVKRKSVVNLTGRDLRFEEIDGAIYVNSARVIESDRLAGNGVVHVIDRVLLPVLKR